MSPQHQKSGSPANFRSTSAIILPKKNGPARFFSNPRNYGFPGSPERFFCVKEPIPQQRRLKPKIELSDFQPLLHEK